jgi:hypothetical protein
MLRLLIFSILVSSQTVLAQSYFRADNWIDSLNLAGGIPDKLLSSRSAVFFDHTLTEKELNTTQEYFQRAGIDAVVYFELDRLTASKDITKAFTDYLNKREIAFLVFIEKIGTMFRITSTAYNGKDNLVNPRQNAWSVSNAIYTEALKGVYRAASGGGKKENMLINDVPELGPVVNPIAGRRNDFFAIDLKVDPLAVPKFGNEAMDKELEEIFKTYYPYKFKMTEPGLTDKELRKQGSYYVLCLVHGRGSAAKELLGYNPAKSETALVSVTYPGDQPQLKNIPSDTPVYKMYYKHIDSGNCFLGTKWDADLTWQQAIINHLKAFKAEFKIN